MPEEIKNEFREDPRTYEILKNSDTQAQADAIIANNVERYTILGGSFNVIFFFVPYSIYINHN
jgi:hypothetical protein